MEMLMYTLLAALIAMPIAMGINRLLEDFEKANEDKDDWNE